MSIKRQIKKNSKSRTRRSRTRRSRTRRSRTRRSRTRRSRTRRGGVNEFIPDNVEHLKKKLKEQGINTTKWENGKSKTVENLYNEIQKGETKLAMINGIIKRIVSAVSVKIYDSQAKQYLLHETSHHNITQSEDPRPKMKGNDDMREKMNKGETPIEAMTRGISEELGEEYSKNIRFFHGEPSLDIYKVDTIKEDSNSYPGLGAHYNWYREEIYIPNLTVKTLYSGEVKDQDKYFFIKELNDDGTFKRNIKWTWKKT